MTKKWIFLLFFPVFALLLQLCNLVFWHANSTFVPKIFTHGFHKSYAVQISGLDYSLLDQIVNEPFHYLGHGKQMIAFESQNSRFVLKLFYPMRPIKDKWYKHWKYWKEYFSLKWIIREQFQKKARLKKLFQRHKLAFEKLKQESGLLFVHLSPSKHVSHHIEVIDKKRKKYVLDLTNTPFVIQEKAILVPAHFTNLLLQNNHEEFSAAVLSLEQLFERRIEKGITDRIQTMGNNYGFVGTKPIQIDVGRIHFDQNIFLNPDKERERILNNFHDWLNVQFPQLKDHPHTVKS